MADALTPTQLRRLIDVSLPIVADANTERPALSSMYTPWSHRQALQPDVTVVRGGRGAGKTYWYNSLLDDELRVVAAEEFELPRLRDVRALEGFSVQSNSGAYPSGAEIAQLLSRGVAPEDLWMAVVLGRLGVPEFSELASWQERIRWTRDNPRRATVLIEEADRRAGAEETTILLLFDALDHLHGDRGVADRLITGLLKVALRLRLSTRNVRGKIFIRPDMFTDEVLRFPDASKLGRSADLTWNTVSLYGLFIHLLGNADTALARDFREWDLSSGRWRRVTDAERFSVPEAIATDEGRQEVLFHGLSGKWMGANHRKGNTYTWLPNHLMDGVDQVSPRSFLDALRRAVEVTNDEYRGHEFALHHEGLRQGVTTASQTRVAEIREDMPWVGVAVRPLEGLQVPITEEDVLGRWIERGMAFDGLLRGGGDGIRTGPRSPDEPRAVIAEMTELGIMRRRHDDRLDMPDVYRVAFRIGRKGGVPRLRR